MGYRREQMTHRERGRARASANGWRDVRSGLILGASPPPAPRHAREYRRSPGLPRPDHDRPSTRHRMAQATVKNQQKILSGHREIVSNQKKILRNQERLMLILANEVIIIRNQEAIIKNQKKILVNQAKLGAR